MRESWIMESENLRESEKWVESKSKEEPPFDGWMMNDYIKLGEGCLEVENELEVSWGCFGHFGQLPKLVRS